MDDKSELKYEILPISEHVMLINGIFLMRIRALRDIPRHNVLAGDLGGWVQDKANLSQMGDCWIKNEAMARGGSQVRGNALLCCSATITDNSVISGMSKIGGSIIIAGQSCIRGDSVVTGDVNSLACLRDVYLTHDACIKEARGYCRIENIDRLGTVMVGFMTLSGKPRFQLYRNKEYRHEVLSFFEEDLTDNHIRDYQRDSFEFIKKRLSRD